MIAVSRRDPRKDAAKARAIARTGHSVAFVGDARQLRKLRDLLAADPEVEVFLGEDDGSVQLWVMPPDGDLPMGSLVWRRPAR